MACRGVADVTNKGGAVFCFQTLNNALIHWLSDEGGIFCQEKNTPSF